jgi:hypothetical protein
LVLLAAGCPQHAAKPPETAATVNAAELPGDVAGLIQYADEQMRKDSQSAVENGLVAMDKARAIDPKNYDVLWRGARAAAWLADDQEDKTNKQQLAQRGMEFAKAAVEVDPKRVEGQYYVGITIGLYATTKTLGARELVPQVVEAAKTALAIDEKLEHAGPLRLLGSVYAKAPPFPQSVGDVEEGLKYLARAVQLGRDFPQNHLLYGDALVIDQHYNEAEREYQLVLNAPRVPAWAHRLERWRKEAELGLKRIERKKKGLSNGSTEPF